MTCANVVFGKRNLAPAPVTAEPAGQEASGSETAMSRRSGEAGQNKAISSVRWMRCPHSPRGLGRGCGGMVHPDGRN